MDGWIFCIKKCNVGWESWWKMWSGGSFYKNGDGGLDWGGGGLRIVKK